MFSHKISLGVPLKSSSSSESSSEKVFYCLPVDPGYFDTNFIQVRKNSKTYWHRKLHIKYIQITVLHSAINSD